MNDKGPPDQLEVILDEIRALREEVRASSRVTMKVGEAVQGTIHELLNFLNVIKRRL